MGKAFWSLAAIAMLAGACGQGGGGDDGPKGEFDPANYSKACVQDSDCMLVTPLSNCGSCCTADTAVARESASSDYARATGACEGVAICLAGCPDRVPACVNQQCELKEPASDAGP